MQVRQKSYTSIGCVVFMAPSIGGGMGRCHALPASLCGHGGSGAWTCMGTGHRWLPFRRPIHVVIYLGSQIGG
jgi:hypothetical protein